MKWIIQIFLLLIFTFSGYSQEICDNGIDDDGNGLTDLQDPTCFCNSDSLNITIPSLIPNHSFEDTNCCPRNHSQMHCASLWQQASPATTDYFNRCGWFTQFWVPPPLPIPHGTGYVGLYYNSNPITIDNYKEYVGICLSDTMFAGVSYTLTFEIARSIGRDTTTFALFGSRDCSNLPFGATNAVGCPTNVPNWIVLDSSSIIIDTTKWNSVTLSFTPSINITTIVLGPSCTPQHGRNYYYLDNLILNATGSIIPYVDIKSKGSICKNNFTLSFNSNTTPKRIQWYKDSITLPGKTDNTYLVPNNNVGNSYQVTLFYDSGCITQTYLVRNNEKYELEMPNVFSPNDDGKNDIFYPIKFECISDATLSIYNRWGQKIHETSDFPLSWDGKTNEKDCSTGVYYWTLDLNGKEGNLKENGTVSLFR